MPTVETAPETASKTKTEQSQVPLFQLILFDDDEHLYNYVIDMLTNLFNMSYNDAFDVAYNVDYIGQALVKTCPLEEALQGKEAIENYGPDPNLEGSTGSMKAAVMEAAE